MNESPEFNEVDSNVQPEIDETKPEAPQPSPPPAPKAQMSRLAYLTILLLVGLSFAGGYITRDFVAPARGIQAAAPPASLPQTNQAAADNGTMADAGAQTETSSSAASQPSQSTAGNDAFNAPQDLITVGNMTMTAAEFNTYARNFADNDPGIGPKDAPLLIVEFSDFECPFCKRFHEDTLTPLLNEYEGLVRFVYRDFPLDSIHPRAQIAAEAAECANEQGRFWLMHDLLFADQAGWSGAPNVFDRFRMYAQQLQMDEDQFVECITSGKYRQEVLMDQQAAMAYGIRGTPSFIVNDKLLRGAVSIEIFRQVLDEELAALTNQNQQPAAP
jgi:protein-disulfide isomerase